MSEHVLHVCDVETGEDRSVKNIRVNGNNSQTHSLGVLLCKRSQTASSTDNGDGLTGSGARFLEALVDCDTSAKDRCDTIEGNLLVKSGDVGRFGNGVLLEGTVDGVAGEQGLEKEHMGQQQCPIVS